MSSPQPPFAFIVLAAGLGSRLGSAFKGQPKWMVPVSDNLTVAQHQLAALDSVVPAENPRIVVSGVHAEAVDALAAEWVAAGRPAFQPCFNQSYSEWNNWYSLLVGLRQLDAVGWRGPTLVVNGDLFCPSEWFGDLIAGYDESSDLQLAVDANRIPSEEAMKVEVSDGRVTAIGKTGLQTPRGEYIGLATVSPKGRSVLVGALETLQSEGRVNDWYEGGIQVAIDNGAKISAWETPDDPWVEIDNEDDLLAARRFAATSATGAP